MAHWRFEQIRKLVKWAKADTSYVLPEWKMFENIAADFNTNRSEVMHFSAWGIVGKSMSAYQPRVTKCGGLPNISFIKRKPKPLGTEFKTLVDAVTRVMTCTEIQEGKQRMQEKMLLSLALPLRAQFAWRSKEQPTAPHC
jgi:hypothetical protein